MEKIAWVVSRFDQLTLTNLYDIINLRCRVFVVEQDIPYIDLDYKDQKAVHLCGYIDGKLVAYCRLFKHGDYFEDACIGRVVVDKDYRRHGYGHDLIRKAIELVSDLLGEDVITISAQLYLKSFYEGHGFVPVSEQYLEDTLPHIRMTRR